jgi:hypothetical protein
MRETPPVPRRTPRLVAVVVLLAAIIGSLFTAAIAPPAGAVPVDGLYTGTITNSATANVPASSAPLTVRLSTSAPNRGPVSASVTLGTGAPIPPNTTVPSGVNVDCLGSQSVPATGTNPLIFSSTSGGVPSSAPRGQATFTMNGSTSTSGITIPIRIDATVFENRDRLRGTATLDLPGNFPFNCSDAVLSFDIRSDTPYSIRTGHDGVTMGGIDITHMIDRHPVGTATPWERCMYLWATPPTGRPVPTSSTWSIEAGAPPGVRILPGSIGGPIPEDPGDGTPAPLRTRVCINNTTPADTTFTVAFAPGGGAVEGRILLWVGEFVNYAGRAQGDVHNTTFDGLHYDYQGVGEYVDAVAADGKDFAVQSRLETVPSAPVSVTTAIAARVNGDRIGVYLDASGVPEWYLNGSPLSVPAKLPSGGKITNPSADHWRVTWPDTGSYPGATTGTTMQVSFARWTPKDHLNIDEILLGPDLGDGQVSGLLGTADRNPANDLMPSTGGTPVSSDIDPSVPAFVQPLYRDFGRSWLVDTAQGPLETLFDYHDPKHPDPASYQNETFPAERPNVVDRKALVVCQKAGVTAFPQIEFCTYDVGVTGAREIAGYYRDGWLPV